MKPDRNSKTFRAAVRAYTERLDEPHRAGSPRPWKGWWEHVLVFDTETTTNELQRMTFGSYRHYQWRTDDGPLCVEEGIFYEDDLPFTDPAGWSTLQRYAGIETSAGETSEIRFMSKSDFLSKVFYRLAYEEQALVVGFNLPFDLMRLAATWGEGRGKFYGGFSAVLWQVRDGKTGELIENRWRPRLLLKLLDSKRAFIEFAKPLGIDSRDKEETTDDSGKRVLSAFRGHFLDLRTLAFALTSESLSLEVACRRFNVADPKEKALEHGRITEEYIAYNRRDVLSTAELLSALADELDRHPIQLDPCKAYSPASVAKAYMRAMGVRRPFEKFADLPTELNGIAMASYYGGRAECHVRKIGVPVVHTDFISMYPTVNALMGLWDIVVAEKLRMEDCTAEAQRMLNNATLAGWFDPTRWEELKWFGEVELDDDIVPIRGAYDASSGALNIAVTHATSKTRLWFTGPDLVASALLRGKPPRLTRAVALVPEGRQEGLQPVEFGGESHIDPAADDFFRTIIEARKSAQSDTTLSEDERERVSQSLKIMANSGSYGIFAEINRVEIPKGDVVPVRVHGLGSSFDVSTSAPEAPGEFCFPPLAALIPGGARLMLALLERSVTDAGGTYAFCDTDSMAIVATDIPFEGAPREGNPPKGSPGRRPVKDLEYKDVETIVARFKSLNPYDRAVVNGSILEIKKVSFDEAGELGGLWVYAIAAKRYAFFRWDNDNVEIVEASEHGLGHLLNPLSPESSDSQVNWIIQIWEWILSDAFGHYVPEPTFLDTPAICRISISSPHVLRPFAEAQRELPFLERIRPTNFLLSAMVQPLGHPVGADPTRFHLLREYTNDSSNWLDGKWTEIHSGHQYTVTTHRTESPYDVAIRSYRHVVAEYVSHPEPKSAGRDGEPCTRLTEGLLQRREISLGEIVFVGKETNRLEDVHNGLVHDWSEVSARYRNPELDPWKTEILPKLKTIPYKTLAAEVGISTRAMRSIRNGHSNPSATTKAALLKALEARSRRLLRSAKTRQAGGKTKGRKKRG
jgi:DNA-binding XRE family transcriptional regulator